VFAIELQAPFAACRPMAAGWYRPTATIITPSAAYGLLLNIAAFEMRLREGEEGHSGRIPASLTRLDLPAMRLAIGVPAGSPLPRVQTVFQQLHNYPVGKDAGVPVEWTKGAKNNITPVRREFLSDVHLVVCVEADAEFEKRVLLGLEGKLNADRYGLPFVGDNAFLIDYLRLLGDTPPCRWYQQVRKETGQDRLQLTTRLTAWVDREDMTKTRSYLFAPKEEALSEPPEDAWTPIPPNQQT